MRYALPVLLVSLFATAHGDGDESVDVYILTGQSNSLGTTGREGGETAYRPTPSAADQRTPFFWSNVSPRNRMYPPTLLGDSGGAVQSLQMQQGNGGADPHFWGPEFGFARAMHQQDPKQRLFVIKASRGGGGNTLWDAAAFNDDRGKGHMWGHVVTTVDAGLKLLGSRKFSVSGLIYMQGESNNASEAAVADKRLADFADNLKRHINATFNGAADNMYTVAVEIAASGSNANRKLTTRLQQELTTRDAAFGFVPTSDLPLKSDHIHFGRDAKLTYGKRIADMFVKRADARVDASISP